MSVPNGSLWPICLTTTHCTDTGLRADTGTRLTAHSLSQVTSPESRISPVSSRPRRPTVRLGAPPGTGDLSTNPAAPSLLCPLSGTGNPQQPHPVRARFAARLVTVGCPAGSERCHGAPPGSSGAGARPAPPPPAASARPPRSRAPAAPAQTADRRHGRLLYAADSGHRRLLYTATA